MRAIGLMTHGGPEVLEVVNVPEVHAGPGQIRIRIKAAAVNPTDVMARNGSRADGQKLDPPPYVPGMDAAGIVDEVGGGVTTGVKAGDSVMAMVVPKASHGAYREQIVLDARAAAPERVRGSPCARARSTTHEVLGGLPRGVPVGAHRGRYHRLRRQGGK